MDAPTLSTMVVLYNTNLKFDVTKLCELLPLNNQIIKIEKRGVLKRGESKRDKIKRRSKKEPSPNNTGFCHNSITTVLLSTGDGSLPEKGNHDKNLPEWRVSHDGRHSRTLPFSPHSLPSLGNLENGW